MKNRMPLTAAALAGLAALGCLQPAVRPDAPAPAAGDSLAASAQDESFDPLRLPEDELLVQPRADWESTRLEAAAADDGPEAEPVAAAGGDFQVQLLATPDRGLADDLRLQALLLFPGEPVEIVWDAPNYKVRVGDEVSREAAEDLKQLALRLGYREAWIVRRKAR